MLVIFLVLTFCNWVFLCHLADGLNWNLNISFFRSFKAKRKYQKAFTLWQRKRDFSSGILRRSGKLSYIGFAGALISTVMAAFMLPLTVCYYLEGNRNIAIAIFGGWLVFSFIWSFLSTFLYIILTIFTKLRNKLQK